MRRSTLDQPDGSDSSRRHALDRILVTATCGRPVSGSERRLAAALSAAEVDHLLTAASRHGVTGFVGHALLPLPELASVLRERLTSARNRVVRDHLRAVSELAVIAKTLDAAGILWLTYKGPALAHAAYPRPHLREYLDLDVLVPREWLWPAVQQLEMIGCTYVDRDWASLEAERAGELKLASPAGVPIDLHWELFNDERVRRAFRIPSAKVLLAGACVADVAGVSVRTLDPVDALLHVALHATTSGGWRLLWLKDVVRLLGATVDHRCELLARASSWQVELVLAAMEERAGRVLDTDVAPSTQGDPRPRSRWLAFMAAIDSVAPVERASGAASLTRIVTNSTRQDARGSTTELLRRTASAADQRVRSATGRGRNRG